MEKIYVITCERGSYDERETTVVCAVTTEGRASELVHALNVLEEHLNSLNDRQREEFDVPWSVSHEEVPPPDCKPSEEFRRLQKLLDKKLGNKADKEAFRREQAQHLKKLEQHGKVMEVYHQKKQLVDQAKEEARKRWFAENLNIPEDLKEAYSLMKGHSSWEKARYEYDELTIVV